MALFCFFVPIRSAPIRANYPLRRRRRRGQQLRGAPDRRARAVVALRRKQQLRPTNSPCAESDSSSTGAALVKILGEQTQLHFGTLYDKIAFVAGWRAPQKTYPLFYRKKAKTRRHTALNALWAERLKVRRAGRLKVGDKAGTPLHGSQPLSYMPAGQLQSWRMHTAKSRQGSTYA